ncbi:ferredoxin [Bacillus coahuilensis p1.1.43]|uniref:Ferredoxin n=1 Tax=Bacillus coahuilensis p1.1.43 TaxID=1150625 RepID=A0A147KB00_9BACI|nr:ferredoxin [Bacillus coahuilensis p1.1.43]
MRTEAYPYEQLITTLHQCMTACNRCYDACLEEDDLTMMRYCIRVDRECSDMCSLFEQALTRNTPFIKELANACMEICYACAEECKKHDHDHCQACADACMKCVEECKKVLN